MKVFDRLELMSEELRSDRSIPKLAQAITLYHIVIEATLAQPGQHFITSYLEDRKLLPGFREGMENVATDEQRHIGFGVKMLSDLRKMDPDVPAAVADLLREVIPWTASVLIPPNWDERYIECFGFTMADIGEEGATSLETKLRTAGMPIDELPGPPVFAISGTPRERAIIGKRMVQGRLPGREGRAALHGPRGHAPALRGGGLRARRLEVAGVRHDPVGLPRRRAVARGRGQRRHARGARARAATRRSRSSTRFEDFVDVTSKRRGPAPPGAARRAAPERRRALALARAPDVPLVARASIAFPA